MQDGETYADHDVQEGATLIVSSDAPLQVSFEGIDEPVAVWGEERVESLLNRLGLPSTQKTWRLAGTVENEERVDDNFIDVSQTVAQVGIQDGSKLEHAQFGWDTNFGEYQLSENNTVVERTKGSNGTWEVQPSSQIITKPGDYRFEIDVLNDPSDSCWMIGVINPTKARKYAGDWNDSHYSGMLVYRGDCGQVWHDGAKSTKVASWGNATGKTLVAKLSIPSDRQHIATLVVIGRDGSEINVGHLNFDGNLQFAMLTYRVGSRFRLVS